MILFLRTCFAWFVLAIAMFFHFILAGIFMFLFNDRQWGHMRISVPFIRFGFKLVGIRMTVEGLENLPKASHFIVMSNHQSLLDILIYMAAIPVKFSFIAKKQLGLVPILGWDIKLQGHFFIDRSNPISSTQQLEKIKEQIVKGRSILMFPEGTRSPDGEIQNFKRGGFLLAQETGTTIVPAYIDGAKEIIKKHSFLISPGDIHVRFGHSIPVALVKPDTTNGKDYTKELIKKTKESIAALKK